MVLVPPLCGPYNDTSSTTKARNAEVITVRNIEFIVPYLKLLTPHSLITDQMREKKLKAWKATQFCVETERSAGFRKVAF